MPTPRRAPGWYLSTPAGLAGPYRSPGEARDALPGSGFPVVRVKPEEKPEEINPEEDDST